MNGKNKFEGLTGSLQLERIEEGGDGNSWQNTLRIKSDQPLEITSYIDGTTEIKITGEWEWQDFLTTMVQLAKQEGISNDEYPYN